LMKCSNNATAQLSEIGAGSLTVFLFRSLPFRH
jgi:hypothetical protein